ncbi:MAG: hypothetical protein NT031_14455 [Planctomycetota bacterium]|nr:hypothetical protein [Planctomycetota bacterium]
MDFHDRFSGGNCKGFDCRLPIADFRLRSGKPKAARGIQRLVVSSCCSIGNRQLAIGNWSAFGGAIVPYHFR